MSVFVALCWSRLGHRPQIYLRNVSTLLYCISWSFMLYVSKSYSSKHTAMLLSKQLLFLISICKTDMWVLILFSTVILFFLVLIVNKWKMSNKLGIAFVFLYALYMIYNILKATKVLPDGSCAPDSSVGSSALQENSTRLL